MERIIFENVRGFGGVFSVPLAPLTLLVGENSSGKSTLLALVRLAWDVAAGSQEIDFNEEPFLLGAFDQIATYWGGRAGRAKKFRIGVETTISRQLAKKHESSRTARATGTFVKSGAQPRLALWTLECEPYYLEVQLEGRTPDHRLTVSTPSGTAEIEGATRYLAGLDFLSLVGLLRYLQQERLMDAEDFETEGSIPTEADLGFLQSVAQRLRSSVGVRPYAVAPIRTRPQRTYDPLKDTPTAEGSHVPMVLAQMKAASDPGWDSLQAALNSFGAASGLFRNVEIRRMGHKESDPFQVRVKVSGQAFNLVDVGYGVSQILPIVVDSLRQPVNTTFLLQQPEVHLHPRAQAELGTFFWEMAHRRKRFVIETHSDYLLDRLRLDLRDNGEYRPRDMLVHYLERTGGKASINTIELDKFGNYGSVPRGYRRFFLEEERRLFTG